MKHAQKKLDIVSLLQFRRREVLLTTLLIAGITGTSPVAALDQHYLDILKKEANNTGVVANTDVTPTSQAKTQATENETLHLEQLETEAKKTASPATPGTILAEKSSDDTAAGLSHSPSHVTDNDIATLQSELAHFTETQRKEMEMALELRNPGIYHLYKQLSLTKKQMVLKEFMENKQLTDASKSVIRLYSGK